MISPVTSELLRAFSRGTELHRAYDHLIAARPGMTLMIPVTATIGRLGHMVDRCPVPWQEADAILAVDYGTAAPVTLGAVLDGMVSVAPRAGGPLASFVQEVHALMFAERNGVWAHDASWRQAQIYMSAGGQPSRLFIGAAGVRFAFTPDFMERAA